MSAGGGAIDFDIQVTQTKAGIPHWLIINVAKIKGNAPPIDPLWLPDAEDYEPGIHVRWVEFFLAAVEAVVVGFVLYRIGMKLFHGANGLSIKRMLLGYAAPIAIAIVAGAILISDVCWTATYWTAAIFFSPLVVSIIVGANALRSYKHAFLASILVFVFLWWALRFSDLFFTEHVFDGLPDKDELLMTMIYLPAIVLLFFIGTLMARSITNRKQRNPKS